MQIQPMGYRIRGLYRVAALGPLWETTPEICQTDENQPLRNL